MIWLTDTSGGRAKSHFWGLQGQPDGKVMLYSACGLFGMQQEMCTTDMSRCLRCKFIRKARRVL